MYTCVCIPVIVARTRPEKSKLFFRLSVASRLLGSTTWFVCRLGAPVKPWYSSCCDTADAAPIAPSIISAGAVFVSRKVGRETWRLEFIVCVKNELNSEVVIEILRALHAVLQTGVQSSTNLPQVSFAVIQSPQTASTTNTSGVVKLSCVLR